MLKDHLNWQAFEQRLASYHNRPFLWGESDCYLFSLHLSDGLCGTAWHPHFYKAYHSKREATLLFYKLTGARKLPEALDIFYGKRLCFAEARRGDVVMQQQGALGVYLGEFSVFRTENGICREKCKKDMWFWRLSLAKAARQRYS